MHFPLFYQLPVWTGGSIIAGFLIACLVLGYGLGRYYRRKDPEADRGGSGDIALTSMYALLGLVLAFTYSFTMSRYDQRKQAILREANALGTAFLRADLAPEPVRSELRERLRDYAATRQVRPEAVDTPAKLQAFLEHSVREQSTLWPVVEQLLGDEVNPLNVSIMTSINDVIDLHTVRLYAAFDLLPSVALWMLVALAAAALAVTGYNRGLVGSMNRVRLFVLALVLAAVITLITDFDRGLHGLVRLDQSPIEALTQQMDAALASE